MCISFVQDDAAAITDQVFPEELETALLQVESKVRKATTNMKTILGRVQDVSKCQAFVPVVFLDISNNDIYF